MKEVDRAVTELGACAAQIHSNVNGRALDDPAFFPVFERLERLGKPVFLHPARPMSHADYEAEEESRYEIFWGLGWAYETSAAMARIVFSGMFDKLPNLKVLAHHWGAYIPHAEGRLPHWEGRSSQSDRTDYGPLKDNLKRPATEYFKMFYADTAMFGAQAASQCGLEFFGADHSLFASDCPFDAEGGRILIRDTIAVVDGLRCTEQEPRGHVCQQRPRLPRAGIARGDPAPRRHRPRQRHRRALLGALPPARWASGHPDRPAAAGRGNVLRQCRADPGRLRPADRHARHNPAGAADADRPGRPAGDPLALPPEARSLAAAFRRRIAAGPGGEYLARPRRPP